MKTSTLLIVIVVGFLTSTLTAQDTVWFDSNWNLTSNENATYYRPVPKKIDAGYWIVDYYISGKKQMEGFSTTNEANKETYVGLVTYYHENGQKFQMVNYINGKPVGKFSEFYDSGELKRSGKYDNGLREGSWKVYHKNGKIQEKGKYSSGEKIGIWKTFHKNI
jgi:antitoxin component YwqK of YwqJK toxin-antitoxin module